MEATMGKWQESYSVGISLIDEQHRELFSMVNTLCAGCFQENKKSAKIFFERNIHAVVEYIRYHFSTEERLLEFIGYSNAARHRQQHVEFLKKIIPQPGHSEMENFPFSPYVRYMRDWLFAHITVSDKDYGIFLRALKQRTLRKNEARQNEIRQNEVRQNEVRQNEVRKCEVRQNEVRKSEVRMTEVVMAE
jgi:hemerythrin